MTKLTIIKRPDYEMVAEINRSVSPNSLTLWTLWPTMNKPEYHRTTQINLDKKDMERLGMFIAGQA